MNATLYVGNLPYNITEEDLEKAFNEHGALVETKVIMDRNTGRPRGFAFVKMQHRKEAQAAIQALDGASLGGRHIAVSEARSQDDR